MGVAGGQAEFIVESLADGADRAIAYDGQRRAHIHAGHEGVGSDTAFVHALIGEAEPFDLFARSGCFFRKDRLAHRRSRPDLHEAGSHQLRADPLVELADGEHQATVLVEERRRPGEGKGMISYADELSSKTQEKIAKP